MTEQYALASSVPKALKRKKSGKCSYNNHDDLELRITCRIRFAASTAAI
jgi:hypothetical protein